MQNGDFSFAPEIAAGAMALMARRPSAPVRVRLLRDVLRRPADDPALDEAHADLGAHRWRPCGTRRHGWRHSTSSPRFRRLRASSPVRSPICMRPDDRMEPGTSAVGARARRCSRYRTTGAGRTGPSTTRRPCWRCRADSRPTDAGRRTGQTGDRVSRPPAVLDGRVGAAPRPAARGTLCRGSWTPSEGPRRAGDAARGPTTPYSSSWLAVAVGSPSAGRGSSPGP